MIWNDKIISRILNSSHLLMNFMFTWLKWSSIINNRLLWWCFFVHLSNICVNHLYSNSSKLQSIDENAKKVCSLFKSFNQESCIASSRYIRANDRAVSLTHMHAKKLMNFRLSSWLTWMMRSDSYASKVIIRLIAAITSIKKSFSSKL